MRRPVTAGLMILISSGLASLMLGAHPVVAATAPSAKAKDPPVGAAGTSFGKPSGTADKVCAKYPAKYDWCSAPSQPPHTIVVQVPLTVRCPDSTATVGTAYSSSITATGGRAPYVSYGASSLPAGLNLNTSTGAITGTPQAAGTTTFTASVTDSAGLSGATTCSITVSPAPITTAIVLTATANGDGTFTLTLTGSGLQPGSEIMAHQVNTGQSFTSGVADNSGNFSRVSAGLGCPASIQPVYFTGTAANGQPYTSPIYAPQPCA